MDVETLKKYYRSLGYFRAEIGREIVADDSGKWVTVNFIIDEGYNPDFGARPLKRAIERLVEDPMSEGLLRGEFKDAKLVRISLKDKKLCFEPDIKEMKNG